MGLSAALIHQCSPLQDIQGPEHTSKKGTRISFCIPQSSLLGVLSSIHRYTEEFHNTSFLTLAKSKLRALGSHKPKPKKKRETRCARLRLHIARARPDTRHGGLGGRLGIGTRNRGI